VEEGVEMREGLVAEAPASVAGGTQEERRSVREAHGRGLVQRFFLNRGDPRGEDSSKMIRWALHRFLSA
jgi:hypothetical protein